MTAIMTIVLDTTTKSLEVVMSGAALSTNPDFTASYADDTGTALTEGANDGALNGTTPVTLVAAPASSTRRVIRTVTIQNRDTAPVTLTIRLNNNTTLRQIATPTLQVGDTWTTDGTFDSNGNLKYILTSSTISAPPLSSYDPWQNYALNSVTLISGNTNTSGPVYFYPFNLPQPVAARHVNIMQSWAANAMSSGSTGSVTVTSNWGVYFRPAGANSTILSLLTSNSLTMQFTLSNAGSSFQFSQVTTTNDTGYAYGLFSNTNESNYSGLKQAQLLLLTTLTQGQYWLGFFDRQSSAGNAVTGQYSLIGSVISTYAPAPFGSQSSAYTSGTNQLLGIGGPWPLFGSWTSAGQSALPSTVALSALTANLGGIPFMSFATTR